MRPRKESRVDGGIEQAAELHDGIVQPLGMSKRLLQEVLSFACRRLICINEPGTVIREILRQAPPPAHVPNLQLEYLVVPCFSLGNLMNRLNELRLRAQVSDYFLAPIS